jgi:hypothetical protein
MSITKLLNEIYKDHLTGKFALLIYFKPKGRYFIVRGKTASLFKMDIYEGETKSKSKKIGYVINTNKIDLIRGFKFLRQLTQLDFDLNFFEGDMEELEENTIYIVNSTYLRKVGQLDEKVKVIHAVTHSTVHNREYLERANNRGIVPTVISIDREVNFLIKLHDIYGLSATEIDNLFLEITGYNTISAKKENFILFEELLQPFLELHTKHKGNIWKKLVSTLTFPIEGYAEYELQFPYFLNDLGTLNQIWVGVKNR